MLTREYEKAGGGYKNPGELTASQKHLHEWTEQGWRHEDGGERYLPDAACGELSDEEKRETERLKREASERGEQVSANPDRVKAARKAAELDALTVEEARRRVAKMSPLEAQAALVHERHGKPRETLLSRLETAARG